MPFNESARVAALRDYSILDTPPERAFDEIVHLAARLCDTPLAAISLVDSGRQWFKSRIGLPAFETARDISFCTHGVAGDTDIFIVPDAHDDERFANSPLVFESPHIRFYAGAKLRNRHGFALGMLCVMDRKPRALTEFQSESLQVLAQQVVMQMELRRELSHHRSSRAELEASQSELRELKTIISDSPAVAYLAGVGETVPVEFVTENVSQWGYTAEDLISGAVTFPAVVHPEDFPRIMQQAMEFIQRGHDNFRQEYRIFTRGGQIRWVADRTRIRRDPYGAATHFQGILLDVTARKEVEAALNESAERYQRVVSSLKEVVFQTDTTGAWTFLNPAWTEITGFSISESLGTDFLTYVHPDDRAPNQERFAPLIRGEKDYCRHEVRYLTKDGGFRWIEVFARLMRDNQGRITGTAGTLYDMTQRKLAEDRLRQSESLYHSLVEHLPLFILRKDPKGRITFANGALCEALRVTAEEILGKTDFDFLPDDMASRLRANDERVMASGKVFECVEELRRPDAPSIQVQITTAPLCDVNGTIIGVQVISRDVTDRLRFETQLQRSLAEKEILLKEIHHRVKNNMQVISSLLNLQANGAEDNHVKTLFADAQHRITSMALVHEKLYQSGDLARIDFGPYLRELVDNLAAAHGDKAREITAQVCADDLQLGIDTAIPCGLIVNELVSNAFKHGFPKGGKGAIWVSLKREEERLQLWVQDTGRGLPDGIDFRRTTSLGMKLVITLVRQLRGDIEWRNHEGAAFLVSLREARAKDVRHESA